MSVCLSPLFTPRYIFEKESFNYHLQVSNHPDRTLCLSPRPENRGASRPASRVGGRPFIFIFFFFTLCDSWDYDLPIKPSMTILVYYLPAMIPLLLLHCGRSPADNVRTYTMQDVKVGRRRRRRRKKSD